MKRMSNHTKRNLKTAAWNTFGSVCWIYNIKQYLKKEQEVDSTNCKDWLKKFSHFCYKIDYVLFGMFAVICGYAAGKALGNAFTPDPDDQEATDNKSEMNFKEVE